MTRWMLAIILGLIIGAAHDAIGAEPATQPSPIVVPLWPHGVPNASTRPGVERDDGVRVWNVSVPGMLVYLPVKNDGKPCMAIVHCPGGSYTHLTRLVGADGLVREFSPRGVAVIALKHRLKPASADVERDALADAERAIRLMRLNAAAWNIDPHRIGLVGASAGANLGLNVISRGENNPDAAADDLADQQSGRPDFVGLLSPWPDGHAISFYPIGKDAPPAFIASARDDKTAPCTFAQAIAAEYAAAGVPCELWLIDSGGHGAFTIGGSGEGGQWAERFWGWLGKIGMEK
jgi:acetyl esterase/lipase